MGTAVISSKRASRRRKLDARDRPKSYASITTRPRTIICAPKSHFNNRRGSEAHIDAEITEARWHLNTRDTASPVPIVAAQRVARRGGARLNASLLARETSYLPPVRSAIDARASAHRDARNLRKHREAPIPPAQPSLQNNRGRKLNLQATAQLAHPWERYGK